MEALMSKRSVVAFLCICCLVLPLHADEPKFKPIDAETVAAYKKLGAKFVKFDLVERDDRLQFGTIRSISFWPEGYANAEGLPGFSFRSPAEGTLSKLPPVNVPFGLSITDERMGDEGRSKLKDLKNLHLLDLGFTSVTDEGLKELKDLHCLTILSLSGHPVFANNENGPPQSYLQL
jgi:hypothetical protein